MHILYSLKIQIIIHLKIQSRNDALAALEYSSEMIKFKGSARSPAFQMPGINVLQICGPLIW